MAPLKERNMDKKTVDKIQNIIIVMLSVGILGFMINDYISRPDPEDQPALATAEGLMLVDTTLTKEMAEQANTFKAELAIRDTANSILQVELDETKAALKAVQDDVTELKLRTTELDERTNTLNEKLLVKQEPANAPETFAKFAAREYKGADWVESGSNTVSVNHLVIVHNWPRSEVSALSSRERRRVHGASHTNKVDSLRARYKAKYGL